MQVRQNVDDVSTNEVMESLCLLTSHLGNKLFFFKLNKLCQNYIAKYVVFHAPNIVIANISFSTSIVVQRLIM